MHGWCPIRAGVKTALAAPHNAVALILHKASAGAWRNMCDTAASDRVQLRPFSGFRSYLYQRQLIRRKLDSGRPIEIILTETAIPGFSEHHTGLAVDVCVRTVRFF